MPRVLALDTSTLTASVALLVDGAVIDERESGVNTHSQELLPLIDACLATAGLALADLDSIAIGAGPGSFTGLRIGMATAKGLCFAAGVPLVPVSSLAALAGDLIAAHGALGPGALVVPIMDARRKEVFVGCFEAGDRGLRAIAEEVVLAPADVATHLHKVTGGGRPLVIGGDGAAKYRAQLSALGEIPAGARLTPSAASVAAVSRTAEPTESWVLAGPSYIRLAEAEIKFPHGNPGGTFRPD